MNKILIAQEGKPLGGWLEGIGPLGESWRFALFPKEAAKLFSNVISLVIGVMTVSAGLWFIFQFFIGAFGWLTAGEDKTAVETARKRITNAVVGLVIVVAAIFLIDFLGRLIGLEILSPGKFIIGIWQK